MKLWVRSDLHCSLTELAASFDDQPDHDIAVIAGDLAGGLVRQIEVIDSVATGPVVIVAGNHEFWRRSLTGELMAATIATRRSRWVRFLEVDQTVIAGVRFVGGTLWTDFAAFGFDARAHAMAHAQVGNNDFRDIFLPSSDDPRRLFTPSDARARHQQTIDLIDTAFKHAFAGPTVVVTHHAPSLRSVTQRWRQDPATPAYASRLDASIERWKPDFWVHGHVHDSFDYMLGDTRVICNPAGMRGENGSFDSHLVVEI